MRTVVIFGREGCCLCDQARAVLERVRATHPFKLEQRDIERDEKLFRAYLERIPVVTIDGEEAFELFVDEAQLKMWLACSGEGAAGASADDGQAGALK